MIRSDTRHWSEPFSLSAEGDAATQTQEENQICLEAVKSFSLVIYLSWPEQSCFYALVGDNIVK